MNRLILITEFLLLSLTPSLAHETETIFLSGTEYGNTQKWDFWCSDGRNAGKWGKIEVPSCWEQQGYGGYTYGRYYIYSDPNRADHKYADYRDHDFTDEYGRYRHRFDVPRQWQGRQVSIVFDGVMTDAEVYVNGELAGPKHQGGFYRFSFDITDKLRYGKKNTLEVTVWKQSQDKSVNAAERRADWWLFGGIYRPVWLECKPQTQIDHVAIDARADGTLRTDLYTKNLKCDEQLEITILKKGAPLASGRQLLTLKATDKQTVETHFDNISPWDTEHPNLYDVTYRLLSTKGESIHEVTEMVGFRTIEFRPQDGVYLNGVKLLVNGTNRHCFHPYGGRTIDHKTNLLDARLIKQMNMNAVRSHYPPDEDFLSICDSVGLLYLDELAGWQNHYSTEIAERLVPEMIFRDVNHPCIFIWSNGNEGGFNTDVDHLFSELDPQHRHVVHPWADWGQLDTRHYPNYQDQLYRLERGQNVFMMTEFLHGLYDESQGAALEKLWSRFRESPLFAGSFLWAYVDEAIWRTDKQEWDTYGPNAPDGIVSTDRQPEGSFWAVREIWSPIQLRPFNAYGSFKGDFLVENGYLFSRLSECRMNWRTMSITDTQTKINGGSVTLPDIAPGETGTAHFDLPANFQEADLLELEAYNAQGDTICTWTYPLKNAANYHATHHPAISLNSQRKASYIDGNDIELNTGDLRAIFDKQTGQLRNVYQADRQLPLSDGPIPESMKMSLKSYQLYMQGETAVFSVKYDGAADSIVWRMTPDGTLGMDAVILNWRKDNHFDGAFFDNPAQNLGFSFRYPESSVTGMTWLGRGPYRVWKNRIKGQNIGLWQKAKNNTVTGEYHEPLVYPEFKGYHGNLYWATLEGDHPMTVYSETDGLFFRIFTPNNQRDHETRGLAVKEYPHGDISFLLEIPYVKSQGGGNSSYIKINRGDQGFRIRLWFLFQ